MKLLRNKHYLLIFSVLFSSHLFGNQTKIDSLKKLLKADPPDSIKTSIYIELSNLYFYSQPDTSRFYAYLLKEIGVLTNNERLNASALCLIGTSYIIGGKLDNALIFLDSAMELIDKYDYKDLRYSNLNSLAITYQQLGDFKHAKSVFRRIISDSGLTHNNGEPARIKTLAQAYLNLGNTNFLQDKFDSAIDNITTAKKLYESIKDSLEVGNSLGSLGAIYLRCNLYEDAAYELFDGLKIAIRMKDNYRKGILLRNLGYLFNKQGEYDKALIYGHKALKSGKKVENIESTIGALNIISSAYLNKTQYDSAIYYGQEALKLVNTEFDDYPTIIGIRFQLGAIYYALSKYDSSLYHYKSVLREYSNVTQSDSITVQIGIAKCWRNLGKLDSAQDVIQKVLDLNPVNNDMALQLDAYKEAVAIYELRGNLATALSYFKKYEHLKDSMLSFQKNNIILGLEAKYQNREKQQQLELLNQQNQLNQATIKEKQRLIVGLILLVFFIAIIAVLAVIVNRNRINKRIVELELKLLRDQMNPHFIFNALNSIQSAIIKEDRETAYEFHGDFAKLMRSVMQSSRQSETVLKDELEMLNTYVKLEQFRTENKFDFETDIEPTVNLNNVIIPSMLLQPIVENAIWHGVMKLENKGVVSLLVKNGGDQLKISVIDNGVGLKKSIEPKSDKPGHQSMATQVINDRIQLYNLKNKQKIEMRINDRDNTVGKNPGTIVEISIPIKFKQSKAA